MTAAIKELTYESICHQSKSTKKKMVFCEHRQRLRYFVKLLEVFTRLEANIIRNNIIKCTTNCFNFLLVLGFVVVSLSVFLFPYHFCCLVSRKRKEYIVVIHVWLRKCIYEDIFMCIHLCVLSKYSRSFLPSTKRFL